MLQKNFLGKVLLIVLLLLGLTAEARRPPKQIRSFRGEERIALVIGNGDYPQMPLRNPVYDVRALAQTLQGLGFTVIKIENGDRQMIDNALRQFRQALGRRTVGLFFFSGHGLQHQGINYLMPIDGQLMDGQDIKDKFISADAVQEQMAASGNKLNLIFLDACRTDAGQIFPQLKNSSQGLAQMRDRPNMLISYATAPDAAAFDGLINSPYAESLVRHLPENLPLEKLMAQVQEDVSRETNGGQIPWVKSTLKKPFSFGSERLPKPYYILEKKQHSSLEELKQLAQAGDGDAQTMLAYLYHSGDRIPRDNRLAIYWYETAAKAGHGDAQYALGTIYFNGLGARQNYGQAHYWWQQASNQNNGSAQNDLGYLYESGLGVRRDLKTAKKFYEKACQNGSQEGCFNRNRI